MKHMFRVAALASLLAAMPSVASARQNDCGTFTNYNGSWQFGDFAWIEFIVETRKPVNICLFYWVGVEAEVVGIRGSSVSDYDVFTASVRRQIPVLNYGVWQTNGKHFRILAGLWYSNGGTRSLARVDPPDESDPEYECMLMGGTWQGSECQIPNSPLIVDTGRNGYRLTSVQRGVLFDIDADGTPERVAWTRPDSDDAFLAMDRNGNGLVDDGSELFGNHSPAHADGTGGTAANGFEALKLAHGPSYGVSRLDDRLDASDAVFSRLLFWRDSNHNGISEPDELTKASDAGLISIGLDYRNKKRVDRHGNQFRQRGRIVWQDGADDIFDIWLQWRD